MTNRLPAVFGAVLGDILAACQLPGGNLAGMTAEALLRHFLKDRLEAAHAILIAEVRRGSRDITDPEIEEAVSIAYRYIRAAREGTARRNLRLMARVIAGQMEFGALVADEFLRHADTLASLRREEVILLATVCRNLTKPDVPDEEKRYGKTFISAGPELIPNLFPTADDFSAAAAALTRTGYLVPHPAMGGGTNYGIGSALERLNRLARLDAMTLDDLA